MSEPERADWYRSLLSPSGLALAGFLAVAGYFLWREHEAHLEPLVPYLPWLLLLACPLLHFFMHRGHGGHGGGKSKDTNEPRRETEGGER